VSADQSPFRFWFERSPPLEYARMLDGCAVIIGDEQAGTARLQAIARAHAVIASARVRYDGELMDRAPDLRVISRTGMGLDNVAVDAATERGIAVCNVPDGPTVSTAEHTIALMLAVAKQLGPAGRAMRDGLGDYFNDYQGIELSGLWLGLVGFGNIGRRVATIAQGFDMRVIVYDPFVDRGEIEALGLEHATDLDALLAVADVVSLHAPLTEETRAMINRQTLARMKPGCILVNAARGGLLDEQAVLEALDSRQLAGAGLDVFEQEPPERDDPLLHRDDVVATPHIAGATAASRDRLWRTAITQALQLLRGERPRHLVNPASVDALGSRR
jgi:D-3-phosphoglycerate dehydrogenase